MEVTEPLLLIEYVPEAPGYLWTCRRCGTEHGTLTLSRAEADGFAHVRECRG